MQSFFYKILLVLAAFLFCQVPFFVDAYSRVLLGHVAEARRNVEMIQSQAALVEKTVPEYVQKFLRQQDQDFQKMGQMMNMMLDRYRVLHVASVELEQHNVFVRPIIVLRYFQKDLAYETMQGFRPSIPLTEETLIFACLGMFFVFVLRKVVVSNF